MTKSLFISFLLGGAFILPIAFLDELWTVAAYFLVSGLTTLVAGRLRRYNRVNLNIGIGTTFVGLMLYGFAPSLPLAAAMVIAVGCGVATFALLEQLSQIGEISPLLMQQFFLSAGNAFIPIAVSFGVGARLLAIAWGAAYIVAALWCHFQRSWPGGLGNSLGSTKLRMAFAAGLATTIQFSYIYAAQQIVDSPASVAAVWVGASVGTLIGRLAAVLFVKYLSWRTVAALVLVTAATTPLFTLANDTFQAFTISLVGVIAISPALPLLIANSFLPSRRASKSRGLFESGPLSLAISTATAGILPLILAITRSEAGWMMTAAAIGLATILLSLANTHQRSDAYTALDTEEIK